ncbi:MAG TPA: prephenate dehydrogenase/arogenate dehydrogenase family protein [Solirubrobacterales bacterium]
MRIAVLGVGLIGGSIGLAARRQDETTVVGFDPDPAMLERALEVGAIDHAAESDPDACVGAEVVFCAAPVSVLGDLARVALRGSGPECVVTDVGSTKQGIVAAIGADERFVGGHPLAGAETVGVENARADLFEGARWYLTPTERSSGLLYDKLQRTIAGLGARPQAIEAEAHDRLMATVSHLPHVVANVLAAQAAAELTGDGERMPEVGPSFRDTTRVAGSNPAIWGDIFSSNREAVAEAVEAVAERMSAAAGLIRSGDREAVTAWHAEAAEHRRQLLESDRPGGPLTELRIIVANRPGTVAELALALGEAGVNIEDMALYPAPDMTSGAVSLWVSGSDQADRAVGLVRELGHTVTVLGLGG